MMNESERLQILEMIEKGIITASEGVQAAEFSPGRARRIDNPRVAEYSEVQDTQPGFIPEPEVIEEAPPQAVNNRLLPNNLMQT